MIKSAQVASLSRKKRKKLSYGASGRCYLDASQWGVRTTGDVIVPWYGEIAQEKGELTRMEFCIGPEGETGQFAFTVNERWHNECIGKQPGMTVLVVLLNESIFVPFEVLEKHPDKGFWEVGYLIYIFDKLQHVFHEIIWSKRLQRVDKEMLVRAEKKSKRNAKHWSR